MNDAEIRELFKTAGVPLNSSDVWSVQGTPVVKHKALEKLAAALQISFSSPDILRAERDEAVILVTGSLGEKAEWSIGEALVNANYRVSGKMAPYVYAMAEKRAKDRVILKLAGLHGVYSEDEADDFREPQQASRAAPPRPPAPFITAASSTALRDRLIAELQAVKSPSDLAAWEKKNANTPAFMFEADKVQVDDAFEDARERFKERIHA